MIWVDLETTANGGPDGTSPEAHWDVNRVLLTGWMHDSNMTVQTSPGVPVDLQFAIEEDIEEHGHCWIVAHNAKFDLKYLMRAWPSLDWTKVKVWDTMTWQYRYTGHKDMFPSLEACCDYYDIKQTKSLDLGALLKSGIKMEDIDIEQLEKYLIGDVHMLYAVYTGQSLTKERYWMDYILPLCEMELNGLTVDRPKCKSMLTDLSKDVESWTKEMIEFIELNCEWQDGSPVDPLADFAESIGIKSKTIKPFANRTISFLLFGQPGELKITNKWRLKSKFNPVYADVSRWYTGINPTHVGYPVDEDKLAEINRDSPSGIIDLLMSWRKASKLLGTYVSPFYTTSGIQGTIHPKLNTAVTSTGRLSSSQPNGQNMPEDARKLCVALPEHEIEELDFSQLEMVGAAAGSKCPDLIYDLTHGVDIHKNTATTVFGADQAEAKRKLAKNVNFGVLYGGKAPGLSKQTGVDRDTIQKLIDAFYSRYPAIARWQRQVYEDVLDGMEPLDVRDGEQRYKSDWILPNSGRKFRFVETEAPMWLRKKINRKWSFSPNHTANYPIQGFAGGDIVMHALWWLWASIRQSRLDVKFRMTVHDSIIIEKLAGLDLRSHYDDACHQTVVKYGLPVPLGYDVETGTTWS